MRKKGTKRRVDTLKEISAQSTLSAPGIREEIENLPPGPGEVSFETKAIGQFAIGDRLGGPERNG
jgi:hypothetical protein